MISALYLLPKTRFYNIKKWRDFMKKMIFSGLLMCSISVLANDGEGSIQQKHMAELKKQGISTEQQLCEYAAKGSMSGGHWDGKACYFPEMESQYIKLYSSLKPLLKDLKPSFDIKKYIAQTNLKSQTPSKHDVSFAGLGAVSSYKQVTDKICSLDFITQIEGKPKANFCANPVGYIVNNLRFHDVTTEDFVYKGNKLVVMAGNGVDITAEKVSIEGVDFDVKFNFKAPGWSDFSAIKGMVISGDVPMEFIQDGNYIGKYWLKSIELYPVNDNDRQLFTVNFSKIKAFFDQKFPGKVYTERTYISRKSNDIVQIVNEYGSHIK
jgi:hypothetical protein